MKNDTNINRNINDNGNDTWYQETWGRFSIFPHLIPPNFERKKK